MTSTYHANGKLLLTSEYFILDGAIGLALPTKFGQTLTVEPSVEKGIFWKSIDNENKIWFEVNLNEQLEILSTTNQEIALTLKNILSHCSLANFNVQLTTRLDFPQNWGLGSSSTLISLLAQWTNANPYELLTKTFGGSGYDIACATAKQPITYQRISNQSLPISNSIAFLPPFSNQLYFLHLNQKQNSREGIQHYRSLPMDKTDIIEQLNELTFKIIHAINFYELCHYLEVHENIISNALQLEKVKDRLFPDFPGTIKSLGAWGGDFVLVADDDEPENVQHYFQSKGYHTLIPYQKMIL